MKKSKNTLSCSEQYGYYIYSVGTEDICDLKEVEINKTKYKVVGKNNTELEYEMGHKYTVSSTKYYIQIDFEGTKALIDLEPILNKIDVKPTKFKIEKEVEKKPAVTRKPIIW